MPKTFEELNLSRESSSLLQQLFSIETWTWTGLAGALCKRYQRSDIEELIRILQEQLAASTNGETKDDRYFDVEDEE